MGLEFAQRHPEKIRFTFQVINGSMSMKMNTELLDLALNKDQKAVDLYDGFFVNHGPLGHKGLPSCSRIKSFRYGRSVGIFK